MSFSMCKVYTGYKNGVTKNRRKDREKIREKIGKDHNFLFVFYCTI